MVVQVRRRVFRAASVPVDYDDDVELESLTDPAVSLQRARMISSAIDDSDALTLASRRHDQQLLSDINSRILSATSAPSVQPSSGIMRKRISGVCLPSYSERPPLRVITSSSESADGDLDDIMPVTTRHLRAGSVPPVLSRGPPVNENSSRQFVIRQRFSLNEPSFSAGTLNNKLVTKHVSMPRKISDSDEDDSYSAAATRARYLAEVGPSLDVDSAYSKLISSFTASDVAPSKYSSGLTPTTELAIRQAHRNLERIENDIRTDTKCTMKPASSTGTARTRSLLDIDASEERNPSFVGPLTSLLTRSSSPGMYSFSNTENSYPNLRRYLSSTVQSSAPPPASSSYKTLRDELYTPLNVSTQFCQTTPSDQTTKVNLTSPLSPSSRYNLSLPLDIATKYNLTSPLDELSSSYMPIRRTTISADTSNSLAPEITKKTRKETVTVESRSYPTTLSHYKTRDISDLTSGSSKSAVDKPFKANRQTADTSDDIEALIRSARTLPEVPSTYQRKNSSSTGRKSAPPVITPIPAGLQPLFKPQLSDTRRRVRDVLCKVKGDPSYFD